MIGHFANNGSTAMNESDSMRVIRRLYRSLVPVQALAVGLPGITTLFSSILIGKFLGENALAAVGFTAPLTMFISAVSVLLSGGVQYSMGLALGRGNREGMGQLFNTVLFMSLVFCVPVSALCFLAPEAIARLLGAVGECVTPTAALIRGFGFGLGLSPMTACLFIFLQMERMDRVSVGISVAMLAVSVGGNALNVFFLHRGLFGAGLFLALPNLAAVVLGLPWLLRRGALFSVSIGKIRWKAALQILRMGGTGAFFDACDALLGAVMNHYAFLLGGSVAVAALSVANNLYVAVGNLVKAGHFGSVGMVASMLVGQRDVASLRRLPGQTERVIAPVFILTYVLVYLLARPFAMLMGADAESLSVYVTVIRLYSLCHITSIVAVPLRAIYQAIGKIGLICILYALCETVFPILLCVFLSRRAGLWLIVSLPWLDELMTISAGIAVFCKNARRLPKFPGELCYVPSSLSVPGENRYDAAVTTVREAVEVSRGAVDFCKTKGLDCKTANYCGLCLEEMAVDAVLNRFVRKKSTLDVRMLYENGHVRILFRDDCKHFDPNEWLELCAPEDELRSIGIRMVSKLARKMEYASTLGLNVLTIEL